MCAYALKIQDYPYRTLFVSFSLPLHLPLCVCVSVCLCLSVSVSLVLSRSYVGQYTAPIDNLYLDMNGIIHMCTHANDEEFVELDEKEMFRRIFIFTDRMFKLVRPRRWVGGVRFQWVDARSVSFFFFKCVFAFCLFFVKSFVLLRIVQYVFSFV